MKVCIPVEVHKNIHIILLRSHLASRNVVVCICAFVCVGVNVYVCILVCI